MNKETTHLYERFFFGGGYMIARLLMLRLDQLPKRNDVQYNLSSLLMWQEDHVEEILKRCFEHEFDSMKTIYFLMEHLTKVMESLPRGYGPLLNMRFGLGTKPREDGVSAHKLQRTMFPALYKAMDNYKEYDFCTEGAVAVRDALDIVNAAKTSELNSENPNAVQYPIENAMEICKAFTKRRDDVSNIYDDVIHEFVTSADELRYPSQLHMRVKIEILEMHYRVYAEIPQEEEPNMDAYYYDLYEDDIFTKRANYPSFMVSKQTNAKTFRIEAVPKAAMGDKVKPDIHRIGSIVKLSIPKAMFVCKYQLLKGDTLIRESDIPEFIFRSRPKDLDDYRIRVVKNERRIDDLLDIQRNFRGIEKRSTLERRTEARSSKKMIEDMFLITKSMEIIEKEFPAQYRQMLAYRKNDNEKRRVDTFWLLSALCLPTLDAQATSPTQTA